MKRQIYIFFRHICNVMLYFPCLFKGYTARNDAYRRLVNKKADNCQLIFELSHHLKAPPWHGPPNDILIVFVCDVVAS